MSDQVAPPPDQLSDEDLLRRLNAPPSGLSDDDLLARLNSTPPPPAKPYQVGDLWAERFGEPGTETPVRGVAPPTRMFRGGELADPLGAFGRPTPIPPRPTASKRIAEAFGEGFRHAGESINEPTTAQPGTFAYGAAPVVRMARTAMAPVMAPLSGVVSGLEQAQTELYNSDLPGGLKEALLGATNLAAPVAAPPAVIQGGLQEGLGAHPETAELGMMATLGAMPFAKGAVKGVAKGGGALLRAAEPGIVRHAPGALAEALVRTPEMRYTPEPVLPRSAPVEMPNLRTSPGSAANLQNLRERVLFRPKERAGEVRAQAEALQGQMDTLRPSPNAPQEPIFKPVRKPGVEESALAKTRDVFDRRERLLPKREDPGPPPTRAATDIGETKMTLAETLAEREMLDAALQQEGHVKRALPQERGFNRPEAMEDLGRKYDAFDLETQTPTAPPRSFKPKREPVPEPVPAPVPEPLKPLPPDPVEAPWRGLEPQATERPLSVKDQIAERKAGSKPPSFPTRKKAAPPPADPPTRTNFLTPPPSDPAAAIKARIRFPSDKKKTPIRDKVKRAKEVVQDYYEGQAPLGRFEKAVYGKESPTGPRAYAEALQGTAQYTAERLWKEGRYDQKKVFETPPERMLKKVWDEGKSEDLSAYAVARRQQSKYAPEGKDIGFHSADAKRYIDIIDKAAPEVKSAAEAVNKGYGTLWEEMHKTGLINDKTWNSTKGDFYVPVRRFFGDDPKGFQASKTSLGRPTIKRVKGGKQMIDDPIPQVFDDFVNMQRAIDNARSGRKVIEAYDVNPKAAAEWMREMGPKEAAKYDFDALLKKARDEVQLEARNAGEKITEAEVQAAARSRAIDRLANESKGEVVSSYFPGGKLRAFKVKDPAMMEAISSGGGKLAKEVHHFLDNHPLGKTLTAPARTIRAGVTIAPQFMAKQMMAYDPFNAAMYDPGSSLMTVPRMAAGVGESVMTALNKASRKATGKKLLPETEIQRIFDDMGPMNFPSLDRKAAAGHTGPKPTTFLSKSARAAGETGKGAANLLREGSELQQASMRRVPVRSLLRQWEKSGEWKRGEPLTWDQRVQATNVGLRSGGSFRLGSRASKAMNKVIPFWTAAERIPLDAYWWAKKNPGKFARRAFTMAVLPHIVEFMAHYDEDWYWDRPAYLEGGLHVSEDVTLPPINPVQLIGVAVRESLRAAFKKNPDGVMTTLNAVADQIPTGAGFVAKAAAELEDSGDVSRAAARGLNVVSPAAVGGAQELAAGRNMFTGRDLNTMGSENLKGYKPELVTDERIAPRVEKFSKWLNDTFDYKLTPLEADHLARSYFGTIGKHLTRTGAEFPEAADKMFTGWMHPRLRASKTVSKFYELRREYDGRSAAYRKYAESGDEEGGREAYVGKRTQKLRNIENALRLLNERYRVADAEGKDGKRELAAKMKQAATMGLAELRSIMGESE